MCIHIFLQHKELRDGQWYRQTGHIETTMANEWTCNELTLVLESSVEKGIGINSEAGCLHCQLHTQRQQNKTRTLRRWPLEPNPV